jgi:hypothetical protein
LANLDVVVVEPDSALRESIDDVHGRRRELRVVSYVHERRPGGAKRQHRLVPCRDRLRNGVEQRLEARHCRCEVPRLHAERDPDVEVVHALQHI